MTETKETVSTLNYVKRFAGRTILIKVGGAALQEEKLVDSICRDLALIQSVGVSIVLVHGGGPAINNELTLRGIQWSFLDGQRVTTPEMMGVIEMALCGHVRSRIVRKLNHAGVRAAGFSGADGRTLQCRKANPALGQVGTIDRVDGTLIHSLLGQKIIPVISPVGIGKGGEALNINADWAAARTAESLGIKKLLFLTDQDGILDQGKLVPELDAGELESLIEGGVVKGGMLAKSQTILHALRNGVADVHVLNARRPRGLIEELFTDRGVGTVCRLRSRARKETEVSYAETEDQTLLNG